MADWMTMKTFYDELSEGGDEFQQARMIFWHLWQGNAYRFVECDLDLESIQNRMQFTAKMFNFRKINPIIEGEVAGLRNESKGLLSAIDILQAGYNEMKEHLSATVADCSGLASTKIATEIADHVNEIQANFDDDFTRSRRRRELQIKKRAARRQKWAETITPDNESDEYYSVTSESDTADSNYEADNMVEVGASSDSDAECLNIGSKRFYLKRKAMNKSAKGLRHMESVSTKMLPTTSDSGQSSPTKKTNHSKRNKIQQIESNNKLQSSPPNTPNTEKRLKHIKMRIEILEENEKLIVLHPSAKRMRASKLSTVAKQMDNCPP